MRFFVCARFWFGCTVFPFSVDDKDMDADPSDTDVASSTTTTTAAAAATTSKGESHSSPQNTSDIKNDQSDGNNGKSAASNSDNGNTSSNIGMCTAPEPLVFHSQLNMHTLFFARAFHAAGGRSNDNSGHNSPTMVESNSSVSNRIPKSELPFREGSAGASDSNRATDTPR